MTAHYVYMLTEPDSGQFYFGVRTTLYDDPASDAGYMGSGCWPMRARKERVRLVKRIIAVFPDRISASDYERRLIKKCRKTHGCRNLDERYIIKRTMLHTPLSKWEPELKKRVLRVAA